MMKQLDFFHVDIKVDLKIFGFVWSKMDMSILISGIENWLYLKKELME